MRCIDQVFGHCNRHVFLLRGAEHIVADVRVFGKEGLMRGREISMWLWWRIISK